MVDLLAGARWWCCGTAPGALSSPAELAKAPGPFLEAAVPGTVAQVLAEQRPRVNLDPDEWDWWYRCEFPGRDDGPWWLECIGLATVADVWLNEKPLLHSENMFVRHRLEVPALEARNELVVRFAALTPLLAVPRRPRPRWKTMGATQQNLRWHRTTLLGRQPGYVEIPPPVGPWRPIRLRPVAGGEVLRRQVAATCRGRGGRVDVEIGMQWWPDVPATARLHVGDATTELEVIDNNEHEKVALGSIELPEVARWWPHTHGTQPRYDLILEAGDQRVDLGAVGFRTVELDRSDDGFVFVVNGVPVFCRGGAWWPVDPVTISAPDAVLDDALQLVRGANMNMVRIPGGTVYEDARFWDRCDLLGIMVWQDCMLGYLDPPDDGDFTREVLGELDQQIDGLGGRPALAMVCGGQEVEEQAAYFGLPRERWRFPLIEEHIPALVHDRLPDVPYLTSSPTGGALPFEADAGDCHYWGVGSLLRDLGDPRRSGIRFMSEGLGLGTPPERATVEEAFGNAQAAGHAPGWKRAVHHDTGRSWDLDDIRDYYAEQLFGLDPHMLRYLDPERTLDIGRATNAELVRTVMSEWRRGGSPCSGALLVALRDFVPGPGWGVVDARSRPKAPWFVLRRLFAPVAVLVTDEGMNGLFFHVTNDHDHSLECVVRVEMFTPGSGRPESLDVPVTVPARGVSTLRSSAVVDGFRDIGYAYRYGTSGFDAVVVSALGPGGEAVAEEVHLPMGQARALEPDVGLAAELAAGADGRWTLGVTTRRLAQWVSVDVPGFRPDDSWFHLVPGRVRTVELAPYPAADAPS
ncbi:MAG TPA: hypothetical protein VKR22_05800, partial [Acidimicrobiales bacterium]|nr:hypothetical protein [Acidimicrobiales bacterium]